MCCSIVSQPSSATSSMGSAMMDADLQLVSRQSSASDLGPRPNFASSIPPIILLDAHNGCLSARSDLSSRSDASAMSVYDEAVEALAQFDIARKKSLTPIKIRPPPNESASTSCPDAPMAASGMKQVFSSSREIPCAVDGPTNVPVRSARMHFRSTGPIPGTYNPYDLAGALADFKSQQQQQVRISSPATNHASHTFSRGNAASRLQRTSSSCSEPEVLVMIPGVQRKCT